MNTSEDALLASNKIFTLVTVLAIYWVATFISLKGLGWVGKVSKIGAMVGTIIPAGLLIVFGIIYISTGGHNNMDMSQGFFPDLTKFDNLVLASGIFLFYAGMEMMGIHVMDVKEPASKNYPKAIFIGAGITVVIFVLGTFALGLIIPAKDINLTQSLLVGFDGYLKYLHISWASPVIAIALMFGVLAGVLLGLRVRQKVFSPWVSRLLASILPENKQDRCSEEHPVRTRRSCYDPGIIVRGYAFRAVVLPDLVSVDRLVVLDYVPVVFSGAHVLRYKMKKANRPFAIGRKSNVGIWIIAGLGFCGALLAFVLSFIPPSQINVGSNTVWFAVLIIGCVVVVATPFIIYSLRKSVMEDPKAEIAPSSGRTTGCPGYFYDFN